MKSTYKLITIFILFSAFAKAQTLKGTVLDQSKAPLPFVNVILNTPKGDLVKATTTNEKGAFTITEIKNGTFNLKISYVGFETETREIIIDKSLTIQPAIVLKLATESLDAVTIVAEKPMIQVEPDKTIFNVAGTVSSAGLNGLELLRKAPGVRLDNNNSVIVEGKTGVLIYIDGRQSFLQGDDLTAFLQSLQADTIESIEIITQPSSKYDAAGNAGIINIKLKREKGLGTRGSVSSTVTVGNFARTNNAINLTSRLKNWNIYGTYSNYLGRSTGFLDLYRIQGDKIFDAQNDAEYDGFSNNFRTGTDYYLSKKSTLGAVVTLNLNDSESRSTNRTSIIDRQTSTIDSILRAPNRSNTHTVNFNTNINYRYQDTIGTSLSADLDYGRYTRDRFNNQPNLYVSPEGEILNAIITYQETPILIDIFATKIDYEQKLGKGTLETGAKVSQVITDNSFNFFDVINDVNLLNTNRSNQFEYHENIYAGYLKYHTSFGKWKIQGGFRVESTDSQGDLTATEEGENESVSRLYTNLFPSAGVDISG